MANSAAVLALVCVWAALLVCAHAAVLEGPWPKFGADKGNSGQASTKGPTAYTGSCQWTYVGQANELRDATYCSPVVWEGGTEETILTVYPSELHAVNVTSQEARWKVSTSDITGENTVPSQLLVTSTGIIWLGGEYGVLRVKDDGGTADPQVAHFLSRTSSRGFVAGPTLTEDGKLVVFGLRSGQVVAFPVSSSPIKPQWTQENPCNSTGLLEVNSVPVVDEDGTVYVACGPRVSALDPTTGAVMWSITLWNGTSSSGGMCLGSGASNGRLFATSSEGEVAAVDLLQRSVVWWAEVSGGSFGQPSMEATGWFLYASASDGTLYRVAAVDGAAQTLFTAFLPIYGQPLIDTQQVVYVSASDGKVYAVQGDELVNTLVMPSTDLRTSPTMGKDGTLYVQGFESMFAFVPESCQDFHSHDDKKAWYYWLVVVFLPIVGGVCVLFGTIALIMWIRKRKLSRQLEEDLLINEDADSWASSSYATVS
eukprot:TRINITY_DN8275_c0_g1_i1.p1 TRINITY_DN8275_c0_g1~~TRINITY_DN8275_c0_g1_i1.p1  ORF type:complete len:482 (+),score=137.18 TRINITY_DN8275_c0_g1_i1:52-1497(+)